MHEFLKDDYNLDALARVRPSGDDFDMYVTPRFVPVYANGYEVLSTRIVKQFVARKDLFIDVGAHYGYYSLLAAKANPGIRIAAVEPIEDNFQVLQKNLQLNGLGPERATCIPAAMSAQAGRAQFCKSEASDNGSLYPHPSSETLARIEVATTCLDDVVGPEKGRRIFVKTDTDGHELEVLKGFSRTLDAGGDVTILLEMNPKMMKISGTSAEEIIAFLHGKDFRLFAIDDREARFYPLDQSVNVAMMEARYRESYYNVLCVRKSAALSVLFFSHAANLTGAERSLVDLIQGLSARGVLCTAILPAPGPLREALVKSGCAVHVSAECSLQGRGWWWAHTAKKSSALPALASAFEVVRDTLIPEIRKLAPDVVFSQTIVSPWGALCAESLGLPHALSAREYGERDHHLAFAFGFRESMAALYASSDAVFCITEDVKKVLFDGDPDRKAVAVYSDVRIPPEFPSAAASGGGNEPAPPRAALTVGIFGSIAGEKGQADLVRACLELCKKGRDVHCVLAGLVADPAYAGALHRQIADSPFADRFVWPDFTDDPYALMRQVDVVVSCSKMEALGRTLLEGVLLGKPIVYANAGGPREIFADGQQGLAYEPGDSAGLARALESILEDPRAAAARARQAREYVLDRFNDESYAGRIFERLKDMARRQPNRRQPAVRELMEKSGLNTMYLSVAQPRLLYADGAGPFSESRAVVYGEMPFGAFDIAFDLPDGGFPHLRFDPTELYAVAASIFDLIITAADGVVLTPDQIGMETNAECVDELTWKFGTLDPQIVWTLPVRAKRVRIVGELKKTSASQLVADLAAVRRTLAGTIDADQLKLEETIAAVRRECKNEAAAIDSTVFIDDGAGYGEGNKAVARLEFRPATNSFAVEFPLPPGGPAGRKIRWDPCEDRFCRCRIGKVETDGVCRGIGRHNARKTENGWDEFMTGDPVYELEGEWAQATFIRISGELILSGADAVADRFQGEVAAAGSSPAGSLAGGGAARMRGAAAGNRPHSSVPVVALDPPSSVAGCFVCRPFLNHRKTEPMKPKSSHSTSLIGTARSLWRAQVSISGGTGPALRYAVGRARSIGLVRLLALFSSHARGPVSDAVEDDIPDGDVQPADGAAPAAPAELPAPAVPEGWAGYAKLSAELSAPARPAKCSPLALLDLPAHRLAAALDQLRFPACESPLVSIVMPVHNQLKYTVECLQALMETDDRSVACEIVLADDASTEPGVERLGQLANVRYFRNDANLGFLRTCNRAAGEARGRYLLFLNNDTQIRRGAIRALVDVFAECPDAGAAGPKVLYPSGHLQEAGGVVRGDLTTEMVGLNDDPERPCYNVRRPVDYCSGVCLMIERETFRSLGGFSEELAPAYYEDVDLCLKVRKAGRQVYYEPRAVIVHHLSKSHAGSGSGAKLALIARNRQRMVEKWQAFVDAAAQIRLIAFYLPQYHPIPENDLWWGKGFTEWRNVAAATPVFDGHLQPRLPGKLGFYDLRVPEIMEQQADLARRYGVHGFCFYYYWFGGKRLLELPLERMLASGRPDFPFCLCWANENWTRRWDGQDQEMLISQSHSPEDDEAIIRDLIRYMRDPRYIRVGGRPLVLVYRISLLPDMRQTSERWRRVCRDEGLGEIALAAVESFGGDLAVDPATYGFDFTVAFPPHGTPYRNGLAHVKLRREALLYPYLDMVRHAIGQEVPHLKRFLGVCPGWDNTPRRKNGSTIFAHATPGEYQAWLEWALRQTRRWRQGDQRMIFINAWNEWGEGAMLEPDASYGPANLEATRNALFNVTVQ